MVGGLHSATREVSYAFFNQSSTASPHLSYSLSILDIKLVSHHRGTSLVDSYDVILNSVQDAGS